MALHEIQQLGFVSRRENAGTGVEAPPPRNGFRPMQASVDDLLQYGSELLRELQSVEDVVTDAGLADLLRCDEGELWLQISSLRVQRDVPRAAERVVAVGRTEVYIHPA